MSPKATLARRIRGAADSRAGRRLPAISSFSISNLPAKQALTEMLDELGYDQWLRQNSSSPVVAARVR